MAPALSPDHGGFAASWQRELQSLRGNRADLLLVTLLPLLMLVVMAWMFTPSVMRDIPIAVVDLDHSSDSRLLLRMLDASPGVRVASQPVDLEDARSQLRSLDVFAIVLVPRDVTRQALRGRQGTVFAYYNATYMTTGQSASRDIGDAVSAWNARLLRERIGLQVGPGKLRAAPIAVQSDILYNPARSYELFLLPLIFPAVLSLVLALAVAGSLGREIRDGTLRAWLGRTPWPAIAGKVAPYILLFSVYGALGIGYLAWLRGDGVAGSVACCCSHNPFSIWPPPPTRCSSSASPATWVPRCPRSASASAPHWRSPAPPSRCWTAPCSPASGTSCCRSAPTSSCRPSSSSSVRRYRFRYGRWPHCC